MLNLFQKTSSWSEASTLYRRNYVTLLLQSSESPRGLNIQHQHQLCPVCARVCVFKVWSTEWWLTCLRLCSQQQLYLSLTQLWTFQSIFCCLPAQNQNLCLGNCPAISGERSQCKQHHGKYGDRRPILESRVHSGEPINTHTHTHVTGGADLGTGQHVASSQDTTSWVICRAQCICRGQLLVRRAAPKHSPAPYLLALEVQVKICFLCRVYRKHGSVEASSSTLQWMFSMPCCCFRLVAVSGNWKHILQYL